jgi:Cleft lip and palate transmembrane protein 1 (CLPTM1)
MQGMATTTANNNSATTTSSIHPGVEAATNASTAHTTTTTTKTTAAAGAVHDGDEDEDGGGQQQQQRKLQQRLPREVGRSQVKAEAAHSSGSVWIPYLKFGNAPVRVRFVAEDRGYGGGAQWLQRSDGLLLHAIHEENSHYYGPTLYVDETSLQRSASVELAPPPPPPPHSWKDDRANDDDSHSNRPPFRLQIKLGSVTPMADVVLRQVGVALEAAEGILGGDGDELDELRYFLQEERMYRFALTQVISYLHVWFDYLAFRDEIRFYRGRTEASGVSPSTLLARLACSVILLLYLLDGGGTSWVVLLGLAGSCAVEAWKVWRILLRRPTLLLWSGSSASSSSTTTAGRRHRSLSRRERETAEYDRIAYRYLAMILYPVIVAWSLYALREYEYKSWYSWLISNLANAVYTFGFISLCPQLYVNYRLKSVAHLPWKVFVYKIFNTFVDDAFAWLIDMPWKHRIMTLRDDVIFAIFLVQVYLYRVDKGRTNEFGYSYGDNDDDDDEVDGDGGADEGDGNDMDRSNKMSINASSSSSSNNNKVDGDEATRAVACQQQAANEDTGGKLKSE